MYHARQVAPGTCLATSRGSSPVHRLARQHALRRPHPTRACRRASMRHAAHAVSHGRMQPLAAGVAQPAAALGCNASKHCGQGWGLSDPGPHHTAGRTKSASPVMRRMTPGRPLRRQLTVKVSMLCAAWAIETGVEDMLDSSRATGQGGPLQEVPVTPQAHLHAASLYTYLSPQVRHSTTHAGQLRHRCGLLAPLPPAHYLDQWVICVVCVAAAARAVDHRHVQHPV